MKNYPRVHADIDLDAVLYHMEQVHRLTKPHTKLLAVIKTDAYGHGAIPIARELENIDYVYGYAVATEEEGLALRAADIQKPILLLGYAFPEQYETLLRAHITMTVFSLRAAQQISEIAGRLGIVAPIHIKLDTGMGRVGFLSSDAQTEAELLQCAEEIAQIAQNKQLFVEGIFTHFAQADETDKTAVNKQIAAFEHMLVRLEARGIQIPIKHSANSASILDLPEAQFDLVRAGIIMYGLHPSEEVHLERIELRPVLSLKSQVVHVKTLPAGYRISYGGTYTTPSQRRIATIPVGYGDGYARSLSNRGEVLIRGKRVPIVGRICMDQFMVDVTELPEVCAGDAVTLIGSDGAECITMEELGEISGRFNYEFACGLGKRIPRIFYRHGKRVACWTQFEGLSE